MTRILSAYTLHIIYWFASTNCTWTEDLSEPCYDCLKFLFSYIDIRKPYKRFTSVSIYDADSSLGLFPSHRQYVYLDARVHSQIQKVDILQFNFLFEFVSVLERTNSIHISYSRKLRFVTSSIEFSTHLLSVSMQSREQKKIVTKGNEICMLLEECNES